MTTGAPGDDNPRTTVKLVLEVAVMSLTEAVRRLDLAKAAIVATVPPDPRTMLSEPPVSSDLPLYENLDMVALLSDEARDVLRRVAATSSDVRALPPAVASGG
ncbi:MAG: hypothetical protein ACR2LK_06135 [Solirubrobacteraceae bacterium]